MATRYTVGIDLGTSNTVVAFAAAGEDRIQVLEIEQLVGRGELAARTLLPSVRYHPAAGELDPATLRLVASAGEGRADRRRCSARRWSVNTPRARRPGARRAVASAKSWLSHAGVDRNAAILPWGAAEDVARFRRWSRARATSPTCARRGTVSIPGPRSKIRTSCSRCPPPSTRVRALTLEAARLAGLPRLRLLGEPQAAFHDWLFRHREQLAAPLAQSRLLLVCVTSAAAPPTSP